MNITKNNFIEAFKPFNLENMDYVFNSIEQPDNNFLAKFNFNFAIIVVIGFSFVNIVLSILASISIDTDTTMKFLSASTIFSVNSCALCYILYQIYKARVEAYFFETESMTRNIKNNYFYNIDNLNNILTAIPISISQMSETKYSQFLKNCNQHCITNKELQMIFNMLENEIWWVRKNKTISTTQSFCFKILKTIKNITKICKNNIKNKY